MNLEKLFRLQASLDERITKKHPPEPGEDRLSKKILALQVELGELANEWRGFKFWSMYQNPRNFCEQCELNSIPHQCKNPLLEEYVDCLHFILSIGLDFISNGLDEDDLEANLQFILKNSSTHDPVLIFNKTFDKIGDLSSWKTKGNYVNSFERLLILGISIGFTWDQIEQAYYEKNLINVERQLTGY